MAAQIIATPSASRFTAFETIKEIDDLMINITFQTNAVDPSNSATYTFSSQAIGTAAADRYVVVAVHGSDGSTTAISGVTIDFGSGDTAMNVVSDGTNTADQQNGVVNGGLFILNVTSGTTATIKVTFAASKNRCGIGIWTITGLSAETANHVQTSTANPLTATLNTTASGVAIAFGATKANATFTPTNYTEDFDAKIESTAAAYTGGSTTTSAGTLALTAAQSSSTTPVGVFASWGSSIAPVVPRRTLMGVGV